MFSYKENFLFQIGKSFSNFKRLLVFIGTRTRFLISCFLVNEKRVSGLKMYLFKPGEIVRYKRYYVGQGEFQTRYRISIQFYYDRFSANPSFWVLLFSWRRYFFHLRPWKLGKPYGFWSFHGLEKRKIDSKRAIHKDICLICHSTFRFGSAILTSSLYWHKESL